jgi:hypothetical protein
MKKGLSMNRLILSSIITIALSLVFSSCASLPRETVYVYDSVFVKIQEDGDFESISPGSKRLNKIIRLKKVGDSFKVKKGDNLKIDIDGADLANSIITFDSDDESDSISVNLESVNKSNIFLSGKCQTTEWYDSYSLPNIEVANGLNSEQIIITPLVNDKCERIGFQIRYGSTGRGCSDEAREVLTKYQKCFPNSSKPTPKKITNSKTQYIKPSKLELEERIKQLMKYFKSKS